MKSKTQVNLALVVNDREANVTFLIDEEVQFVGSLVLIFAHQVATRLGNEGVVALLAPLVLIEEVGLRLFDYPGADGPQIPTGFILGNHVRDETLVSRRQRRHC